MSLKKLFIDFREGEERGRGRERRGGIGLLYHLLLYSLFNSCTCPDWRLNSQPWCRGWRFNPLRSPARASLCLSMSKISLELFSLHSQCYCLCLGLAAFLPGTYLSFFLSLECFYFTYHTSSRMFSLKCKSACVTLLFKGPICLQDKCQSL